MTSVVEKHPVTTRLYGVGLPTWVAFAVAGWPIAVAIGIIALFVILVARK